MNFNDRDFTQLDDDSDETSSGAGLNISTIIRIIGYRIEAISIILKKFSEAGVDTKDEIYISLIESFHELTEWEQKFSKLHDHRHYPITIS